MKRKSDFLTNVLYFDILSVSTPGYWRSWSPSISLEAFEVGDEVYTCFEQQGFDMQRIALRQEKWHIDLWEANRMQLLDFGVLPSNIELSGICTWKENADFFSARRQGIASGRILSGIMLKSV